MKGFLGPYAMTREGSGTSWVPDTTPHEGIYGKVGDWSTMWHGYLNLIYDHQGGPRGGDKTFVNGMVMGMAQRPLGDGTLGVRAMLSPDPFMGKSGYPLLLASGETADGQTHLIDRQHPHDLFMELAGDLQPQPLGHVERVRLRRPSRRAGARAAGLHASHQRHGHSRSADHPPLARLHAHHLRRGDGRAHRRQMENRGLGVPRPRAGSISLRHRSAEARQLQRAAVVESDPRTVDAGVMGAAQLARATRADRRRGSRHRVGDLHAAVRQRQPVEHDSGLGPKILRPGETLDGYLLESAVVFKKTYTLFMRAERVAETELHEDVPALEGQVLMVNKLSVGGIYDFYRTDHVKFGIGGLVSKYALPGELKPLYGSDPTSAMVFLRLKVI